MNALSLCELMPTLLKLKDKPPSYGNQERFGELKDKAVLELSEMISKMREDPNNYKTILNKAAELRHRIAVETKTPDPEKFGAYRHENNMTTHLYDESYTDINKKIKDLVLHLIPSISDKSKGNRITSGNSRYTFRLNKEPTDIEKHKKAVTEIIKTYDKREAHVADGTNHDIDERINTLIMADEYKYKIKPMIHTLKGLPKPPFVLFDKNIYIFSGRIELKVNNEWKTLTRHFSVITCDDAGNITDRDIADYKLHGFASLLHSSHEDFKFHEIPMNELFNKIINKNTPAEELHNLIRDFEYRLHHLCYFVRGSAAINEIILEAIKKSIYPQYVLKGNLNALWQPYLSTFSK